MIGELTSVHQIVRKMKDDDRTGNTKISKYVDFNYREDIDTIEAYKNSTHISGKFDELDREKPFFDIITMAINTWYRSTDIDRSKIKLIAGKDEDIILSTLNSMTFFTF